MRYGIIGTGAIGGYYGAKLARAGQEVHFLLHSDYEYVKQHGLQRLPARQGSVCRSWRCWRQNCSF